PAMTRRGYPLPFTAAVTSSSSTISIVIPPSIPMIFFGVVAGVSVGTLFAAGILPGIIIGLTQMLICYVYAVRFNYPVEGTFSWKRLGDACRAALPAILMPAIILGGI